MSSACRTHLPKKKTSPEAASCKNGPSKAQCREHSLWVAPFSGICSEKAGGSRGQNRGQSASGPSGIVLSGPLVGYVPLISAVSGSAGPGVPPAQRAWRGPRLPTGDGAKTPLNLKMTARGDLRVVDQNAESLSWGWEWGVVTDHHQEVGAPLQRGQGE